MGDSDKRFTEAAAATGSRLADLYGIGPVGAARILGDRQRQQGAPCLVDRHRIGSTRPPANRAATGCPRAGNRHLFLHHVTTQLPDHEDRAQFWRASTSSSPASTTIH